MASSMGHPRVAHRLPLMRNTDARSGDYDHLKDVSSGSCRSDLGGQSTASGTTAEEAGPAPGRPPVAWWVGPWLAGACSSGCPVQAWVSRVGRWRWRSLSRTGSSFDLCERYAVPTRDRLPDGRCAIEAARAEGDTLGGMIGARVSGMPGWSGRTGSTSCTPISGKAMLSINAVKGFQVGGQTAASMRGSAHNDDYRTGPAGDVRTLTNRSGGVGAASATERTSSSTWPSNP